jgi:hypothetical protein
LLSPPLLARRWLEGFATLFTAAYGAASGRLDYRWPDRRVPLRLDEPVPTEFPLNWTIRMARNIGSPDALHRRERAVAECRIAPRSRADEGRSGAVSLLLTGPERVWVTAVIRSRLELGERSAGAPCQDFEGRCCTPGGIAARYLPSIR